MIPSGTVSKSIEDRRRFATHGASGIVGLVLGIVLGHTTGSASDPDRDLVFLVSDAIDRGQAYWETHIPNYRGAKIRFYEETTETACGVGLASSGPFYCPADERLYVDLSFLRAIHGDLARAYVIEHELGHHTEKLRGEFDAPSITLELLADCRAGELMAVERDAGRLAANDLDGALAEAAAVGDDRLAPGSSPESWTHGSSAQRVAAVRRGLSGAGCNRGDFE